jgi:hypothetical protein
LSWKHNNPIPQKRTQLHAISPRSVPEVKRRGLGEGQVNTPINHLHLGEVSPLLPAQLRLSFRIYSLVIKFIQNHYYSPPEIITT